MAQTRWRPEVVLPRRLTTQLRKTTWCCQAVEQRTAPWRRCFVTDFQLVPFAVHVTLYRGYSHVPKRQSRHHTPYSERGHFSQGQAKAKTWTGRQKATALKTCTFPSRVRRAAAIRETQRKYFVQVRKSETQSKAFRPPSLSSLRCVWWPLRVACSSRVETSRDVDLRRPYAIYKEILACTCGHRPRLDRKWTNWPWHDTVRSNVPRFAKAWAGRQRRDRAPGSKKKKIFVPDNNHTTQENTGGVWFFIAATPKHQIVVSNHTKNRVD